MTTNVHFLLHARLNWGNVSFYFWSNAGMLFELIGNYVPTAFP